MRDVDALDVTPEPVVGPSGTWNHYMWWVENPFEPADHKWLKDYSTVVTPVSMANLTLIDPISDVPGVVDGARSQVRSPRPHDTPR